MFDNTFLIFELFQCFMSHVTTSETEIKFSAAEVIMLENSHEQP